MPDLLQDAIKARQGPELHVTVVETVPLKLRISRSLALSGTTAPSRRRPVRRGRCCAPNRRRQGPPAWAHDLRGPDSPNLLFALMLAAENHTCKEKSGRIVGRKSNAHVHAVSNRTTGAGRWEDTVPGSMAPRRSTCAWPSPRSSCMTSGSGV